LFFEIFFDYRLFIVFDLAERSATQPVRASIKLAAWQFYFKIPFHNQPLNELPKEKKRKQSTDRIKNDLTYLSDSQNCYSFVVERHVTIVKKKRKCLPKKKHEQSLSPAVSVV
jgi:hypothetical protein